MEFEKRFTSQSKGGVLNDLPPEVIQELTFGLVARLAKKPRKLTPKCFAKCCGKSVGSG